MPESWKKHYEHFTDKLIPPSATLSKALELFSQEKINIRHAIDLGCGNGIDTHALLQNNWQVLAIDKEEEALNQLDTLVAQNHRHALAKRCSAFEELTSLPSTTLVNASFSLPFCHPNYFDKVWQVIVNSIQPNGRFSGHFFGNDDSWSSNTDMTFHNMQEIEALLSDFNIEALKEVNKKGKTVSGKVKHWHVFHIVARKNTI
ncbi:class I SAM-dependent methyltransferase [Fulvivirga sp. RKSG066]|uniref:class I SAM-dependent methyltransferase n=1 Tax=Fulvivirga aurantia TaxID=2529383 RepID=UPI0012BD6643|nr:class I SAM-dependent methyltransferase [Fulvivirga aurantia]MTI22864.1 class I SAM-dependent methyltransferase [Fulvivirga aurantia]